MNFRRSFGLVFLASATFGVNMSSVGRCFKKNLKNVRKALF